MYDTKSSVKLEYPILAFWEVRHRVFCCTIERGCICKISTKTSVSHVRAVLEAQGSIQETPP